MTTPTDPAALAAALRLAVDAARNMNIRWDSNQVEAACALIEANLDTLAAAPATEAALQTYITELGKATERIRWLEEEHNRLRARAVALLAALRPFAELLAYGLARGDITEDSAWYSVTLAMGEIRRAAALVEALDAGEAKGKE